LLRPYLLRKKKVLKYMYVPTLVRYIKFRQFHLIRNRDFSRARIRRPTCILFNERIMMAITREADFVSRTAGEWRNSSERVIAILRE
jgi:hypothetical protein